MDVPSYRRAGWMEKTHCSTHVSDVHTRRQNILSTGFEQVSALKTIRPCGFSAFRDVYADFSHAQLYGTHELWELNIVVSPFQCLIVTQ